MDTVRQGRRLEERISAMKARWLATAMLMGAFAHPAAAQSWDSPAFFAPGPHDDIGFYFIDADGGDLGFLGMWRQSGGTFNLGIRAGMGGPSGDRTALVGAEFAGDLVARRGAQPFGVSWLVGAGASFDGTTWLRIPAGVSIGITIPGPSFLLTPYIHPRIAIDVRDRCIKNLPPFWAVEEKKLPYAGEKT
jgi:hypothetical protein